MPTLNKKTDFVMTVAMLDPAGGKKQEIKRTTARSAIIVVSGDSMNRIFVRETWAERCATENIIAKVFDIGCRYQLTSFGIEANAQQSLFVDTVRMEVAHHRLNIPILPVKQPTTITKEFRIRTQLQPVVASGNLFLKKDQKELLDEIVSFPMSSTVDMIDALASAVSMIPKQLALNAEDHETAAYLQYLRDSGASPLIIERAAREAAGENVLLPEEFRNMYHLTNFRS